MSTFLAYTPPAAGHVFPLVPGLLALRARGHRVVVQTSPGLAQAVGAAGLETAPLDPRIVQSKRTGVEGRTEDGIAQQLERGPFELEDLRSAIDRLRPDAVLVDTLAYGGSAAAEASGRPWATTLPSLLPYPGAGIPPYSLGLRRRTDMLGRLRDRALWRVVEHLFSKAMLPGLNQLRESAGLAPYASPLEQILGPDRLIVLTGEPLEHPRSDAPQHVRFVGGQVWDPPADRPAWLGEPGDPWVLVTCSTDYQGDEALPRVAVEALRDQPFRVLVTLADAHGAELPHADNLRVERFVPHGQVLPQTAAVVCPAGMGIVHKSLAAGVPVVAVPFGRDQPEVARRLEDAGLGVRLPAKRLRADRLRAAVHEAVALSEDVRRHAAAVDAGRHAELFADAAEELLTVGRTAGRSGTVAADR